jgi:hypothetical protein
MSIVCWHCCRFQLSYPRAVICQTKGLEAMMSPIIYQKNAVDNIGLLNSTSQPPRRSGTAVPAEEYTHDTERMNRKPEAAFLR